MTSLAEALPAKIHEMNEVIIPQYEAIIRIAPLTAITVAVMRQEVKNAINALASGDVLQMLSAYAAIKDYEA